jgi:glycosyltransferase involved in cell wall biosynthesis
MNRKSICLNMIVKNESKVIQRCLDSVKGMIDYWVIVDTGSTDGTQTIIKECLQDIPGELHEREWKDFGHNRNEALALARNKADYLLFIDADDQIIFLDGFTMPDWEFDCYLVLQKVKHTNNNTYSNNYIVFMIKDLPDFKWEGSVHEAIICSEGRKYQILPNLICQYMHDGGRSKDPGNWQKDIELLEETLQKDPFDRRSTFFLAQTYRRGGGKENYQQALKWYEKRASMGGREDEVYYSRYCMGLLYMALKMDCDLFTKSLGKAHLGRPIRAEPLYAIASYYVSTENYWLGYQVAKAALSIPLPIDLFVEPWIYEWGTLLQFYICCRELEKHQEAYEALKKLLSNQQLPQEKRKTIERDLYYL